MSLVNQFQISLKDFLPDRSDGTIITDQGRGTTTTVSDRLYAKLRAYAGDNRLPLDSVVHQLREEIHRTSAPGQPGATMTDADRLAYFTGVLKQLDALRDYAPKDSTLSELAAEATEPIGSLVGYLIGDGRK